MSRAFDTVAKNLSNISEEEFNQDTQAYGDRTLFTVQWRRLYDSSSGNLSVVRRVGWDSKAGSSHRYSIIHVPTRTDLGVSFDNEGVAREFVDDIEERWDWGFTHMGDANINQDEMFRLAGKRNGLNFLGRPILTNPGLE